MLEIDSDNTVGNVNAVEDPDHRRKPGLVRPLEKLGKKLDLKS